MKKINLINLDKIKNNFDYFGYFANRTKNNFIDTTYDREIITKNKCVFVILTVNQITAIFTKKIKNIN